MKTLGPDLYNRDTRCAYWPLLDPCLCAVESAGTGGCGICVEGDGVLADYVGVLRDVEPRTGGRANCLSQ